jgi:hypothetical protein
MYQFDAKLVRARTTLIREPQLTPCASTSSPPVPRSGLRDSRLLGPHLRPRSCHECTCRARGHGAASHAPHGTRGIAERQVTFLMERGGIAERQVTFLMERGGSRNARSRSSWNVTWRSERAPGCGDPDADDPGAAGPGAVAASPTPSARGGRNRCDAVRRRDGPEGNGRFWSTDPRDLGGRSAAALGKGSKEPERSVRVIVGALRRSVASV